MNLREGSYFQKYTIVIMKRGITHSRCIMYSPLKCTLMGITLLSSQTRSWHIL